MNQWKQLQAERYERRREQLEDALEERREQLRERWQQAALRSRFHELEFTLHAQRKRLEELLQHWRLQPAGG